MSFVFEDFLGHYVYVLEVDDMILKIDYDDMMGTGISVIKGKARKKPDIIMVVNESNVVDAVAKYGSMVRRFLYDGEEYGVLNGLDCSKLMVKVVVGSGEENMEAIDAKLSVIPDVNVILSFAEGYSNMYLVKEVCQRYSRVRVCGGHFCQLDGVRLGCISKDDVQRLTRNFVCKGCACCEKPCSLGDFEVEFSKEKSSERKTKSRVDGKTKKSKLPSNMVLGDFASF